MERSLQFSSSDLSKQLEVWSHLPEKQAWHWAQSHLCSISMHWPLLQVNCFSEQLVSLIGFTWSCKDLKMCRNVFFGLQQLPHPQSFWPNLVISNPCLALIIPNTREVNVVHTYIFNQSNQGLLLPSSNEASDERLEATLFESFRSYLCKNAIAVCLGLISPNPRGHWLVVEKNWCVSPNKHWQTLLVDDVAVHPSGSNNE